MDEGMAADGKAQRADARRNRASLIAAAHVVFAGGGPEAPMDEVAHAAGVGVATVYRHFPSKDLLVDAVMEMRLGEALQEIENARVEEADAWAAFVRFVRVAARMSAEDQALSLCLGGSLRLGHEARALQLRLVDATMELMRAAQLTGHLRGDLRPGDMALLLGIGHSSWVRLEGAPDLLGRYLAIIIDGLKAPGGETMPGSPLKREEINDMLGV
jgi:AcrR family transcriptional regulator